MRCGETSELSAAESGRNCRQILEHKSNFATRIPNKCLLPEEKGKKMMRWGSIWQERITEKRKRGVQVTGRKKIREDKSKQGWVGDEGLCCHWLSGSGCFPTAPLQPEWQDGDCFSFGMKPNRVQVKRLLLSRLKVNPSQFALKMRERTGRKVQTPSAVNLTVFLSREWH